MTRCSVLRGCVVALVAAIAVPGFALTPTPTVTPTIAPGAACDIDAQLTAPNWMAIGTTATMRITLQATTFVPSGATAYITTEIAALSCKTSPDTCLWVSTNRDTNVSYVGDGSLRDGNCGVTWSSDNAAGGATATVAFTPSSPVQIASGASCYFEYDVNVIGFGAGGSPTILKQEYYTAGSCSNSVVIAKTNYPQAGFIVSAVPTDTPIPATSTPTSTPTSTNTPTDTPTSTPTNTPTPTPTATASPVVHCGSDYQCTDLGSYACQMP